MVRFSTILTLATALDGAGCSSDLCGGYKDACVGVTATSGDRNITQVDQLVLGIYGPGYNAPMPMVTPATPQLHLLPVTTALYLPWSIAPGTETVVVSAFFGGNSLAGGAANVMVAPGQHSAVTVPLYPKRYVFLLDQHSGDLGGPAGADRLCTAAGQALHSGATFRALLGTVSGGSIAGLIPANQNRIVVRADDMPVAFDSTFFQANHTAPINLLANKMPATTRDVWTNFNATGNPMAHDCSGWTSSGIDTGVPGDPDASDGNWAFWAGETIGNPCGQLSYVYCIEQ